MTKNITSDLWEYLESQKSKEAGKVLNWLNYDWLNSIQLDGLVFWYEVNMSVRMPNYVYNYIKKWGKKQGYIYLYDLPTN